MDHLASDKLHVSKASHNLGNEKCQTGDQVNYDDLKIQFDL